jgi:hypothetical protein
MQYAWRCLVALPYTPAEMLVVRLLSQIMAILLAATISIVLLPVWASPRIRREVADALIVQSERVELLFDAAEAREVTSDLSRFATLRETYLHAADSIVSQLDLSRFVDTDAPIFVAFGHQLVLLTDAIVRHEIRYITNGGVDEEIAKKLWSSLARVLQATAQSIRVNGRIYGVGDRFVHAYPNMPILIHYVFGYQMTAEWTAAEREQRGAVGELSLALIPYANAVRKFHEANAGHPYEIGVLVSLVTMVSEPEICKSLMPHSSGERLVDWLSELSNPSISEVFFSDRAQDEQQVGYV